MFSMGTSTAARVTAMSRSRSTTAAPFPCPDVYSTPMGRLFCSKSEKFLAEGHLDYLRGQVQLVFTSPPFPLNEKKKYGNLSGVDYLEWLSSFAAPLVSLLRPQGSIVIELGNSWERGVPVQSLLPLKSLLRFMEEGRLSLCQELFYYNPARLPSPAPWVTIRRVRLKDAVTRLWWMSPTPDPKADNRRVLRPYSESMQALLSRGRFNSGKRPSAHSVGLTGFLADNGGAIAPNLIQVPNTSSSSPYQEFCRSHGIEAHPARMPIGVAEFFIKFLSEEGDIVLDPFAGSNTTGEAAERLGRRWVAIEANRLYAASSAARFDTNLAARLIGPEVQL